MIIGQMHGRGLPQKRFWLSRNVHVGYGGYWLNAEAKISFN